MNKTKTIIHLDGSVSVEPMTQAEIDAFTPSPEVMIMQCKEQLASTDYKAIKYAEGLMTDEEYEPIRQHRMELRKLINELEINYKRTI